MTLCFDQLLWAGTDSTAFRPYVNSGFVRRAIRGRGGIRPLSVIPPSPPLQNAGDGVNSFALNGSFSVGVLGLSCGGDQGCYTFQVREGRPLYTMGRTLYATAACCRSTTPLSSIRDRRLRSLPASLSLRLSRRRSRPQDPPPALVRPRSQLRPHRRPRKRSRARARARDPLRARRRRRRPLRAQSLRAGRPP